MLAAGLAVAAAEFAAAFVRREAAPLVTVGQSVIDRTPRGLKEYAVRQFGTNDKAVLQLTVGVLLVLFAAVIGAVARRWLWAGLVGVGLLGVLTLAAAISRPADRASDVVPALIGAFVGAAALTVLTRPELVRRQFRRGAGESVAILATGTATDAGTAVAEGEAAAAAESAVEPAPTRRNLLLGSVGLAALLAGVGRWLQNVRFDVSKSRASVVLPAPAAPAPAKPVGSELGLPGLSPHITANKDFYRIDTALVVPEIPAEDWKLRIHGRVDREIELDFAALTARPTIERDITLCCVSNEVGGPYIGTAKWLGVPLADLLREAGVHPDADQLVSRSHDGMTIGTPTAAVTDGRDAMLAIGMNGEPLPIKHGFPVRMVVPGLYGYVSACKWIVEIEATRFADYDAYWVPRGWAQQAPVKTQSRIDTPKNMAKLGRGVIPVAGVAWAQHKGIAAVEVQIDDEPWQRAELAAEDTVDTWRQFVWYWDARPGPHRIRVRATDKTGQTQTPDEADVAPDGATGWHTIAVNVTNTSS
ncbi:MAG: molybdopterin-dependent oxidoreductase [Streptomycetaceae bacterium]|nr:molybdopterin-dependent oxidoreductase [Streptomycetaceae bacterium]